MKKNGLQLFKLIDFDNESEIQSFFKNNLDVVSSRLHFLAKEWPIPSHKKSYKQEGRIDVLAFSHNKKGVWEEIQHHYDNALKHGIILVEIQKYENNEKEKNMAIIIPKEKLANKTQKVLSRLSECERGSEKETKIETNTQQTNLEQFLAQYKVDEQIKDLVREINRHILSLDKLITGKRAGKAKDNLELLKELDQCCGKERVLADTWEDKEDNQVCLTYSCSSCGSYISSLEEKEKPMILTEKQYKKLNRLSWEIQGKTYEIESLLEELKGSEEERMEDYCDPCKGNGGEHAEETKRFLEYLMDNLEAEEKEVIKQQELKIKGKYYAVSGISPFSDEFGATYYINEKLLNKVKNHGAELTANEEEEYDDPEIINFDN
ncbi:7400_t:CDS:2, partial [Scutellospora calospora]